MTLTEEVYIGGNYEHRKVVGSIDIRIGKRDLNIELNKVRDITLHVGYWRKANSIHDWFVENIADGVDNCEKVYVSHSKLLELKAACISTLETLKTCTKKVETRKDFQDKPFECTSYDTSGVDMELNPLAGFFFGSTEVDDWFVQDLEDTIEIVDSTNEGGEYYYEASW